MDRRRVSSMIGSGASVVRKHKPDYRIALYMGLLMMLGLIIMFAIGPQRAQVLNSAYDTDFYTGTYFFGKQAFSLGFALVVFVIFSRLPLNSLRRHSKQVFYVGLGVSALLAFAALIGWGIAQCSLGACRWIDFGFINFQPAELLKLGLLLFGASFIAVRSKQGLLDDTYKSLIPLGVIMGAAAFFVIVLQQDMGSGLVILGIITSMLIVGGVSLKKGLAMFLILLAAGVLMIVTAPHRMARVLTFFQGDVTSTSDASAYHIAHAKIAIGSGGFDGVGIGNSVQATGYLPEAINDSVFAIMGETFGFIGLVLILLLFTALLFSLLRVADRLNGTWERLVAVGVFGWLASHVVLNVAAMTGIFPLTGITLPLLSFGGTSMVFIAAALGIVFQLSQYTVHVSQREGAGYEDSRSRRGLGRPRYAGSSRR
jgi:cell division protein FtsW